MACFVFPLFLQEIKTGRQAKARDSMPEVWGAFLLYLWWRRQDGARDSIAPWPPSPESRAFKELSIVGERVRSRRVGVASPVSNADWKVKFPEAHVVILARTHSDHNPIIPADYISNFLKNRPLSLSSCLAKPWSVPKYLQASASVQVAIPSLLQPQL